MKITMTNGEAYIALQALENVKETGTLGFSLAKTRRRLVTELSEYLNIRAQISEKYAIDDGYGGLILPPENVSAANAELAPYSKIECSFEPVQVDEAVFTAGGLTAQDMYVLDFMLKEEEEPNEIS